MWRATVDREAAGARIERDVKQPLFVDEGGKTAIGVSGLRVLDFYDVCAEIGQKPAGDRSRHVTRKVDNPHFLFRILNVHQH